MVAHKKSWLHKRLKLSHHKHTGKMLAVEHTSRGVLVAIMLVTGVFTGVATHGLAVSADTQSGEVKVSGTVKLLPPSQRAVILKPTFGQTFTNSPIIVSGTCQVNDFVQIYRNHKAVDAVACIRGEFGATVDLVPGKNNFVIRTLDITFQFGPNSEALNVYYYPPAGAKQGGRGLQVTTDSAPFGYTIGQDFYIKVIIEGGIGPYATSITWGDGKQDIFPANSAGQQTFSHSYQRADTFDINVAVKDSVGDSAGAETGVLVGGPSIASTKIGGSSSPPKSLVDIVWPIYLVSLTAITLFWLGEHFELALIKKTGLLIRKK